MEANSARGQGSRRAVAPSDDDDDDNDDDDEEVSHYASPPSFLLLPPFQDTGITFSKNSPFVFLIFTPIRNNVLTEILSARHGAFAAGFR